MPTSTAKTPEEEQATATTAEAPAEAATEPDTTEYAKEKCPTCGGRLIKHGDENPHKAGALHCAGTCGTCWNADLKEPRA